MAALTSAEEPPYLTVGTDVSAKFKGAFCEAKITNVDRIVKLRVLFKGSTQAQVIDGDQVKEGFDIRIGAKIEARHPIKQNQYSQATISKITDHSRYTVIFDDGDSVILRRNSLRLKSGKHFAESETLDRLPLTNPEHFGNPVKVDQNSTQMLAASSRNTTNSLSSSLSSSIVVAALASKSLTDSSTQNLNSPQAKKTDQQQQNNERKKLKRQHSDAGSNSSDSRTSGAPGTPNGIVTPSVLPHSASKQRRSTRGGRRRRDSSRVDTPPFNSDNTTDQPEDQKTNKRDDRHAENGHSQFVDEMSEGSESEEMSSKLATSIIDYDSVEVGTRLRVEYGTDKLLKVYEAKILKMETFRGRARYYVHYLGWNNRYDEWITRNRIVAIVGEESSRKGRKGNLIPRQGSAPSDIGAQSANSLASSAHPSSATLKSSIPSNSKSSSNNSNRLDNVKSDHNQTPAKSASTKLGDKSSLKYKSSLKDKSSYAKDKSVDKSTSKNKSDSAGDRPEKVANILDKIEDESVSKHRSEIIKAKSTSKDKSDTASDKLDRIVDKSNLKGVSDKTSDKPDKSTDKSDKIKERSSGKDKSSLKDKSGNQAEKNQPSVDLSTPGEKSESTGERSETFRDIKSSNLNSEDSDSKAVDKKYSIDNTRTANANELIDNNDNDIKNKSPVSATHGNSSISENDDKQMSRSTNKRNTTSYLAADHQTEDNGTTVEEPRPKRRRTQLNSNQTPAKSVATATTINNSQTTNAASAKTKTSLFSCTTTISETVVGIDCQLESNQSQPQISESDSESSTPASQTSESASTSDLATSEKKSGATQANIAPSGVKTKSIDEIVPENDDDNDERNGAAKNSNYNKSATLNFKLVPKSAGQNNANEIVTTQKIDDKKSINNQISSSNMKIKTSPEREVSATGACKQAPLGSEKSESKDYNCDDQISGSPKSSVSTSTASTSASSSSVSRGGSSTGQTSSKSRHKDRDKYSGKDRDKERSSIREQISSFCEPVNEVDCEKKIAILEDRLDALRQIYTSIKTKLSSLEKRQKRGRYSHHHNTNSPKC